MPISTPPISSKPLFGNSNANSIGSLISEKEVEGKSGHDQHYSKSTLLDDAKHDGTYPDTTYNNSPMRTQSQGQTMPFPRSTIQGNFSISSKGMGFLSGQESVSSEIPAISGKGSHLDGMTSQSHSVSKVFSFPASASSSSSSLLSSASSVPAAVSSFPKPSPLANDLWSKPLSNPKSSSEASRSTLPLSTSVSLVSGLSSASTSDKSQVHLQPQKEEPSHGGATYLMEPKITVATEPASAGTVTPVINLISKLGDYLPEVTINKCTEERKPQSSGTGAAVSSSVGFSFKLEEATVLEQKAQEEGESSEQHSSDGVANVTPNFILKGQQEQPISTFNEVASTEKKEVSGNAGYQEEEMEEQAPEVSPVTEISLESLGAFGLGSTPPKAAATTGRNPFGESRGGSSASPVSSPFTMPSPGADTFRPASFSFTPTQSQQAPSPPTGFGGFGSSPTPAGFGFAANQASSVGGFGQPAQVGQGQQAMGSVLGSFGQSRQIGIGQPANSFAPASSFVSGFTGNQSGGGFANAATKSGGFASLASNSGGFASLASNNGGFAAAASANAGGFNTGTPAGTAAPAGGSGFGGFSGAAGSGVGFGAAGECDFFFSHLVGHTICIQRLMCYVGKNVGTGGGGFGQQGSSFSAFGGSGAAQAPPQLFTQMRK